MKRKLRFFMRKIHRVLAIPMALFVLTKLLFGDTSFGTIITKVTSVTMLIMVITGTFLFFLTLQPRKMSK